MDKKCFFTKNGEFLGIAFKNMPQNLYPTVGFKSGYGSTVEAHFPAVSYVVGKRPFMFHLDDFERIAKLHRKGF